MTKFYTLVERHSKILSNRMTYGVKDSWRCWWRWDLGAHPRLLHWRKLGGGLKAHYVYSHQDPRVFQEYMKNDAWFSCMYAYTSCLFSRLGKHGTEHSWNASVGARKAEYFFLYAQWQRMMALHLNDPASILLPPTYFFVSFCHAWEMYSIVISKRISEWMNELRDVTFMKKFW